MYFPDLSLLSEMGEVQILSVGWLEKPHPYLTGPVDSLILEKLSAIYFTGAFRRIMRGFHPCDYCGAALPSLKWEGQSVDMGYAELWIPLDKIIYVAPTMIYHYMTEHHYLPPEGFLHAVQHFDLNSDGEDI